LWLLPFFFLVLSVSMGKYDAGRFFVSELLPECMDQDLEEHFRQFGMVQDATVIRDQETTLSKCSGFVRMQDPALVQKILRAPHKIWQRAIKVSERGDAVEETAVDQGWWNNSKHAGWAAWPEGDASAASMNAYPSRGSSQALVEVGDDEPLPGQFFVAALEHTADEADVREHFGTYGEIEKVVWGKKGYNYCFVTMADPSSDKNISVDEHVIKGQKATVKPYLKKPVKEKGRRRGKEDYGGWGGKSKEDYSGWGSKGGGYPQYPAQAGPDQHGSLPPTGYGHMSYPDPYGAAGGKGYQPMNYGDPYGYNAYGPPPADVAYPSYGGHNGGHSGTAQGGGKACYGGSDQSDRGSDRDGPYGGRRDGMRRRAGHEDN